MKNPKIAASLICADPINIKDDLISLINCKVDFIHFDVMDGHFVPRYGLYPEVLKNVKETLKYHGRENFLPFVDVHMMVQNPEDYIEVFQKAGADYYCPHYEACPQLHRTIKKIKDSGMKVGVALNFHTKPEVLEYVIDDVDMVVLMAINPGIVGHKLIEQTYMKIRDLKEYLMLSGRPDILIEIDGGVTFDTAPKLIEAGADILVCGTGTIFRPHENTIMNKVIEFRKLFEKQK